MMASHNLLTMARFGERLVWQASVIRMESKANVIRVISQICPSHCSDVLNVPVPGLAAAYEGEP